MFIAADHFIAECVGIYADRRATRFQALEPIRLGVRHDHSSQYMSDTFQNELRFSASRARAPSSALSTAKDVPSASSAR